MLRSRKLSVHADHMVRLEHLCLFIIFWPCCAACRTLVPPTRDGTQCPCGEAHNLLTGMQEVPVRCTGGSKALAESSDQKVRKWFINHYAKLERRSESLFFKRSKAGLCLAPGLDPVLTAPGRGKFTPVTFQAVQRLPTEANEK